MTPTEQAIRYLAACPPAVSGQGGHDTAFGIVCTVVNGFALSEESAMAALSSWNAGCSPPWTEKELLHKVRDALRLPHNKPRGGMVRTERTPARKAVATTQDGARALIRAAFEPGEGIRIAPAVLNDDDREVPDGAGVVLSREEWLRRLDAVGGDPNGIYTPGRDRTGIYISVNPMKVGGSKDDDVTAYRHALIEFDGISQEEQLTLYRESGIPCTAVIDSGGKSMHAWVKVDATTRKEYDERVAVLYEHFASYKPDAKNRNPSRFSRMPGCVRFSRRQELVATSIGAPSWSIWVQERAHAALGRVLSYSDYVTMDTANDPNCVIGFRDGVTRRYLCKGKSAWLIGPSGVGKSTLLAEFAIGWAMGSPVFGITPRGPLKSLIIQAENDDMDIAEMVRGIDRSHDLEFHRSVLDRNIVFKTESCVIRQEFCDKLHRLIDAHKPDIVWCDPLLSFAGIDISKQDQASEFLRQMLQPVLESTGAVLIGVHHTGKPKSQKETSGWTAIDHAYSGIGSSELVNWARAVMVVVPHGESVYELKLAKRGSRAAATHPDGTAAFDSVWLRQGSAGVIRWDQIVPPAAPPKEGKDKHAPSDLLKLIPEGKTIEKKALIAKAVNDLDIGEKKAAGFLDILLDENKVKEVKVKRPNKRDAIHILLVAGIADNSLPITEADDNVC